MSWGTWVSEPSVPRGLQNTLSEPGAWHCQFMPREIPETTVSLPMEKLWLPQGAHLIWQVAGSSLGKVTFCSWKKVSLFQELSSP